jgi:tRNA(Ile)-lysidine synthase
VTADDDALRFGVSWLFRVSGAPQGLGLAVSGGSDSLAMLHLLAPGLRAAGKAVAVATVNHGLRPEAAAEAALVARACAALGVPHDTLFWQGWDGRGNLPAAARAARYALLADWARGRGLSAVALAHTADDQAETILMRIARGSGVDGLSGMAVERRADRILWLRPLLHESRAALRGWLAGQGVVWAEDPTNDDAAYDRVKVRQALPALAAIGITAEALGMMSVLQGNASRALRDYALRAAQDIAQEVAGAVVLDRDGLARLPYETQLRLLAEALRWVASAPYRPRLSALQPIHAAMLRGQRRTLHGAILIGTPERIIIARECRPVADLTTRTDAIWDGRWRLTGPHDPGLHVGALGEGGLLACPAWRATGLPRAALLATPAIWCGDALVSAPLARPDGEWAARIAPDFVTFLKCD